jgi:hypothetical protein
MFAVVSVWRPAAEGVERLAVAKKHGPLILGDDELRAELDLAAGGEAPHHFRPESSFHSMTSMAMVVLPRVVLGRGLSKISRRRAILRSSCSAVPRARPEVAISAAAAVSREGRRTSDDTSVTRRGIVGVDLVQLGLADLQLIEQPLKP